MDRSREEAAMTPQAARNAVSHATETHAGGNAQLAQRMLTTSGVGLAICSLLYATRFMADQFRTV